MELVAVEPQTMDTADLADRLQELVPDWLAGIDVAPETKQTCRRGLQLFFDWLSRWGRQLGPLAIRTWREELRKAYAPSSVNTWLSGTRSFFSWALEMGLVPYDPTAGVRGATRRGTSTAHKRGELTANEVLRVLATCDDAPAGKRNRAIISLMAYCALRQVEVQRADVEDLKTKDGRLVLWVQGKGRVAKDEFVVLPAPAEDAVRAWCAVHPSGRGALFVSLGPRNHGRRLSRRSIRRLVKDAYRAAGVVGNDKTTHSLRHSAISTAIRNGASVTQVQAMARHANVNTTMIYFHETGRTADPAEDYIAYQE